MASGLLAQALVLPLTFIDVYTVPANTLAVVTVNVVAGGYAALYLYKGSGDPTALHLVHQFSVLDAVVERQGLVLDAGTRVVVSGVDETIVSVWGFEEPA